ncbi:hypothetical protein ACFFX0_01490 [Citricoccus parietis]|uniref:Uncharacterized protein n=1 Tax=Citricoccus parietis TaxID=592307 RepID=A0ABV5FTC0_9MICC
MPGPGSHVQQERRPCRSACPHSAAVCRFPRPAPPPQRPDS